MRFEETEVMGFEGALRGLRNPKESWHLNDSHEVTYDGKNANRYMGEIAGFFIGPNDLRLAQTLIRAGSEHRKFMRQIFVSVDITAPLYFWKEFDTYKVGTVANSTSTMHKIASKPITLDCFEIDDYESKVLVFDTYIDYERPTEVFLENKIEDLIDWLEDLRKRYLETSDIRYWKELIRWLPSSWLQTRTVTMSYENLFAMCGKGQRRFHKLTEWKIAFINWARTLPYAQELIFIDELDASKQEKVDELFNSLGIIAFGETGERSSFGEILTQLGKIYPTLDKKEQDKIVNLILK